MQRLHTTLEMEEKILMKRTILAVSAFAASLMVSAVAVSAPVQAEEIFHSRKAVAEVVDRKSTRLNSSHPSSSRMPSSA